ncbi:hypothetical protein RBU60_11425 [Mesonia sp. MT50]|uniref:Lipoprotein n=1 Tax=Mesonia profundi TaxID=3070998 RepID=A0ABU1A3A4_9FLAO|nr:hypothetical protein [Mesonia profundi]MDQ7918188.1 hypothetical protein [Mesonia profundi]
MKSVFALSLVLIMFSCDSTKSTNDKKSSEANSLNEKEEMSRNISSVTLESGCLPAGECAFEVIPNTKMDFKIDTAEMLYPEFVDDVQTNTIKFSYNEDTDKELMDGHYREEIYFEVKNGTKEMDLQDMELKDVNFLYGRFCYCKGSAGYFKVDKGNLTMKNGKLTIEFANGQVPQKLGKITASYK